MSDSRWTRLETIALTLLRVVGAFLYWQHGAQKTLGWIGGFGPGGGTAQLGSIFGAAGVIELVGGTLILIGLGTRAAAFICSGEMAVAYFMMHAPMGFWPAQNHGEIVVMFCFTFLYLAARGGGPYSVDALIARGRRMRP